MNRSDARNAGLDAPDRQAIGLDVGGTKISGGIVAADGALVDSLPSLPTPGDQHATFCALQNLVDQLCGRYPRVEAIGVGTAGLVEWPDGNIRWAPNNAYRSMPLRRLLEEASGLPTVVDNDANTATWAEARIGKSADYMMFLTIGTGVGGGFLLNGELYRGTTGIGAEVGHIVVDPQGRCRCSCGLNGCLEALASGTALGRYGREAAAADPTGHLATLAGQPPAVTGQIVQMAAEAGDPVARSLYARLGFWLGVGIASLVTVFDPELIVLGGGVATAGDMLLAPTRVSFEEHLFARAHRRVPPIVGATLGVEAGWAGAGLLALDLRRELRRPMLGEPASSSS